MTTTPSLAVRLFGTEEEVAGTPRLKAGPLEASLDAGNLRHIKLAGREAIRAVSYIVRDRNWGTYNPEITNLLIQQDQNGFEVTYDAVCRDAQQAFAYKARISADAHGNLAFEVDGEALTDFVTNRTGFVVLHGVEGISGAPVEVEHVDGTVERSRFPEFIDPMCPFKDIRTLTHEVFPGVKVACRMEGDTFEMEDQRNWTDASYKTYVRPLELPWPYTIEKSERFTQKVSLTITGALPTVAGGGAGGEVTVRVGEEPGHFMPLIGLAIPPEHAAAALERTQHLRAASPAFVVGYFDPRQGHDAGTIQAHAQVARALKADLVLEIVLPCLDADGKPTDSLDVLRRDLRFVKGQMDRVSARPARIAVSPAADLKCTLPGGVWPKAPSWNNLLLATKTALPGIPVGGGMFSYFTELNRKRPPAELLDFITHTTCPLVHAGDDLSLTEGLEALPYIFKSTQAFARGKPYWLFPTAISMRMNPYGAIPAENPGNIRVAMARVDPRERALIGSAWYLGYAAHAARAGLDALTLAAVAGPSGIVHTPQPHAQPWFDEAGGVFPSFHVIVGLAGAKGARQRVTTSSSPRDVQCLAHRWGDGAVLWLANLTGTPQTVRLDGFAPGEARVLDETTFVAATRGPEGFAGTARAFTGTTVELAPYAVWRLQAG